MSRSGSGEETRILEWLRELPGTSESVVIGAGRDDCAVVRHDAGKLLVLKTDCVIEGIHYLPEAQAAAIGWKAVARVLSDLASTGARPRHALITVAMERDRNPAWGLGIYRGIAKAAREFSFDVVGGETSRTQMGSWISVAMTGVVRPGCFASRENGCEGDKLYVTGRLGGAVKSGRHLRFSPRLEAGCFLVEDCGIRVMMDLSDGLASDLPRLARASGLGYLVDVNLLPRNRGCSMESALSEGEDYELLFAVSPRKSQALERKWRGRFPALKLTQIGTLVGQGKGVAFEAAGFDHFAT